MIFDFPSHRYSRRHGPSGYRTYHPYKVWLRDEFTFRCVFCLVRERWYPNGDAAFSVDHLIPKSLELGVLDYENLLYACLQCNSLKLTQLGIPDPCAVPYGLHLKVNDDGTVSPLSTQGKILIDAFWLNDPERVRYRDEVLRDFRYFRDRLAEPEAAALFKSKFGFPDNLPDLRKNKPRRNSRPEGIRRSYYARRQRGRLSDTY